MILVEVIELVIHINRSLHILRHLTDWITTIIQIDSITPKFKFMLRLNMIFGKHAIQIFRVTNPSLPMYWQWYEAEEVYRQCSIAGFISRGLNVLDLVAYALWYAVSFIPIDNFNHLIQGKRNQSQRNKKVKWRKIAKCFISLEHTSREANNDATPMGIKTMLTSMNAEITCTKQRKRSNTEQVYKVCRVTRWT